MIDIYLSVSRTLSFTLYLIITMVISLRRYDESDYSSKMVQCGKCNMWVHAECEKLSDEMYEILSVLPDNIPYLCVSCLPKRPAPWQFALWEEMSSGEHDNLHNEQYIYYPVLESSRCTDER